MCEAPRTVSGGPSVSPGLLMCFCSNLPALAQLMLPAPALASQPPPTAWALGGGGTGRNALVLWGAEELLCLQGLSACTGPGIPTLWHQDSHGSEVELGSSLS